MDAWGYLLKLNFYIHDLCDGTEALVASADEIVDAINRFILVSGDV